MDHLPYGLHDNRLSFTVSFESLDTTTGIFNYDLLRTHYGEGTFFAPGRMSQPVPTPVAAPVLLLASRYLHSGRRMRRTVARD
jgi:hypothetical protein